MSKIKFVAIISTIIIVLIGLLFIFLPVRGEMEVNKLRWNWDIRVERYMPQEHSSWSLPPPGAYDIRVTSEIRKYRTYTDASGYEHRDPVYENKYYYTINEWVFDSYILNSGFDKDPKEADCTLPYTVESPKIGALRRGGTRKTYEVIGEYKSKKFVYQITKENWKRLEIGGKISFYKFRFGKKIWGIDFI